MLSKVLMWAALANGVIKGVSQAISPPPPEPPEGIGIWWCPECNRWQPYAGENPVPVCFSHKKAAVMKAAFYTHAETE